MYGFACFAIFLEGGTLALGLPFTLLVMLITLIWGRKRLAQQPVPAFFFVSSLVAFLLFTRWELYWGGFPLPSGVGLVSRIVLAVYTLFFR